LSPPMAERQTATYRQPHKPAAALKGVRVLLVEDEPLVAMDVEAILTDQGCEIVGVATTVQSAGVLIDQGGFDVVLLDCNLMGQPVGALAQRLRDIAKPFAFATGYGVAGLPDGFESVRILTKPYRAEELIGVVAALTSGSTAARLLTPASFTPSVDYLASAEISGGEPQVI
jgi:DNA-binding response OmpR family regulator